MNRQTRGINMIKECRCPKCGEVIKHSKRGVPCSNEKCPKCGSLMQGKHCQDV